MNATNPPVVLVTGANRGIGLEVARQLAARGCRVFLGARRPAEGERAAAALQRQGLHAEALHLDVVDEASIQDAAAELGSRAGRLDVLVNNAGILLDESMDILHVDGLTLRQTLETNTIGALRVSQAMLRLMKPGSRIVNVSSGGGQLSSPSTWSPAYCISKTALNAVTVQLAAALKPRRIRVNAACPGWVRTDMGGAGAPLSVEQGADTILWLALDAPEDLTGGFFQDRQSIPW